MSISFQIDTSIGVVFSTARGAVRDEDLLGHQQRLRKHQDFRSDLRQLFDFRGVEPVDVSETCVKQLAYHTPFGQGSRRAFVVDSDFTYGLARQYQALTGSSAHELAIFRDIDEARSWLGIS